MFGFLTGSDDAADPDERSGADVRRRTVLRATAIGAGGGIAGCLGSEVRSYESTPVAPSGETASELGFDDEPRVEKQTAEVETDLLVREVNGSITGYSFSYVDRGSEAGASDAGATASDGPICVERVELDGVNGFCEYGITDLEGDNCPDFDDVFDGRVLLPCGSEDPLCDAAGRQVQFVGHDCTATLTGGTPRCSELLSGEFWVYCGVVERVTDTPTQTSTPTASPTETLTETPTDSEPADDGGGDPTQTPTATPTATPTETDHDAGADDHTPSPTATPTQPGEEASDTFTSSSMPNPTVASQTVNPPADATPAELIEEYTPVFERICDCEVGDPDQIQLETVSNPENARFSPDDVGQTLYQLESLGAGGGLDDIELLGSEEPVTGFVIGTEGDDGRLRTHLILAARTENDSESGSPDTVYTAYVAEHVRSLPEEPVPIVGTNGLFTAGRAQMVRDRHEGMAEGCGETTVPGTDSVPTVSPEETNTPVVVDDDDGYCECTIDIEDDCGTRSGKGYTIKVTLKDCDDPLTDTLVKGWLYGEPNEKREEDHTDGDGKVELTIPAETDGSDSVYRVHAKWHQDGMLCKAMGEHNCSDKETRWTKCWCES